MEYTGFSIQLGIQPLTWVIKSFHLSAMPLGSLSTAMFGVGSVSCLIATAVGLCEGY